MNKYLEKAAFIDKYWKALNGTAHREAASARHNLAEHLLKGNPEYQAARAAEHKAAKNQFYSRLGTGVAAGTGVVGAGVAYDRHLDRKAAELDKQFLEFELNKQASFFGTLKNFGKSIPSIGSDIAKGGKQYFKDASKVAQTASGSSARTTMENLRTQVSGKPISNAYSEMSNHGKLRQFVRDQKATGVSKDARKKIYNSMQSDRRAAMAQMALPAVGTAGVAYYAYNKGINKGQNSVYNNYGSGY